MKNPRLPCAKCDRPTAAGPVAGRSAKGRMWRHDAPGQTRTPGQPLESCIGSLDIIDLPPIPGRQMELDLPALDAATPPVDQGADPGGSIAMF